MDSAEKKVVVRVHCSTHNRLVELSLTSGESPAPKHFTCIYGLCYPAGVVCNQGGKPCTGFPETVQELVHYLQ